MTGQLKLVVIGDGGVGKTCLLYVHRRKQFPMEYIPTVFDGFSPSVMIDGKPFYYALWDTAGQEEYDRLRPISYPGTDVVLILFDISHRSSFQNIQIKWYPEITHHIPGVPLILVGTKIELRNEYEKKYKQQPVTYQSDIDGKNSKIKTTFNSLNFDPILHPHVLFGIFGFLTPSELCLCAQVCKSWKKIADDDFIWRFHVLKRWGMAASAVNWKEIYRKRHLEELARGNTGPTTLESAFYRVGGRENFEAEGGCVSKKEGEQMAKLVGAQAYFEVSSLTQEGVDELFDASIRVAIHHQQDPEPKKKKKNKFWFF